MRRFLLWWSARLPVRIIADDGMPYLERYYVCSVFGTRCYLHRFVGSDPDAVLHDHPWRWALSIILVGWYFEERRDGAHVRSFLNFLVGDNFHRVVLPAMSAPVWTLFIHRAGRSKPWGFLRPFSEGGLHAAVWVPYVYGSNEGNSESRWWLYAPLGRDEPRRLP